MVYASYYPTDIFPQTGNDTEMLKGMYVTNNLWAYQAMRDGDNLATPFGGPSGNEPDYFRIRAVAFNANNVAFDTLYFYLADYRFEDNSQDYIVTDWRYFDLSSFGEVSKGNTHLFLYGQFLYRRKRDRFAPRSYRRT